MNNTAILPLTGIGEIRFGYTRNQVKSILGEPSEMDTFRYEEDDIDELTESWHYDEHEISFSFDEIEDWKLTNISVSGEKFTWHEKIIIGLNKSELLNLIQDFDGGEFVDDEENGVITVLDSQTNFWFDEGEVTEIQWNVDWDEEGEAIFP